MKNAFTYADLTFVGQFVEQTKARQQSVLCFIMMIVMDLVTSEDAAKCELLLNKPILGLKKQFVMDIVYFTKKCFNPDIRHLSIMAFNIVMLSVAIKHIMLSVIMEP